MKKLPNDIGQNWIVVYNKNTFDYGWFCSGRLGEPMALAKGRRTVIVEPLPGSLSIEILPLARVIKL